jgi:hypothetical protein
MEQFSFRQINIYFFYIPRHSGVIDSGQQHWAFPGFLVDLQSSTGYITAMARKSAGFTSVHLYDVIGAK